MLSLLLSLLYFLYFLIFLTTGDYQLSVLKGFLRECCMNGQPYNCYGQVKLVQYVRLVFKKSTFISIK